MTSSTRYVGCATGVVVLALLLLVPLTSGRGSEMEEGAAVAYSARVLDGAVPHRDFLTFYGPGNLWAVAGAFAVFGERVATERAVGLLYRIVIVLSLFMLAARIGGLTAGLLAGVLSGYLLKGELVWANATYGAIAFGLLGLVFVASGAARGAGRAQELLCVGAGVAGGVAVLMRFDFAPVAVISAVPVLMLVPWGCRLAYAMGLLGALAALAVHVVVVGPARVEQVLSDLAASGSGRSLPLPSLSKEAGQLLAAGALATLLLVAVGAVATLRVRGALPGRLLLAGGLFSAALIPYSLSRADEYHARPLAIVSVSLLPSLALYVLSRVRIARVARVSIVGVTVLLSVAPIVADARPTAGAIRQLHGIRDPYYGFYLGDADPARRVVARAQLLAEPGDSLFVGPQDLRRTNYGPTYMYFLLRQLRPASYYMEMNPLTANSPDSGLADDLRRADWLILTSKWDAFDEPNDTSKLGPAEPNVVVRDAFCLRFESGEYRLYERCDRAA